MDANSSFITNLLVSDADRSKAQLKYELKKLENRLERSITAHKAKAPGAEEVQNLCQLILAHYLNYLPLLGIALPNNFFIELEHTPHFHWSHYYNLLLQLKKQLGHTTLLEMEKNLLIEISSLYYQIIQSSKANKEEDYSSAIAQNSQHDVLYQLFISGDLKLWLLGLVNFSNQSSPEQMQDATFFHDWDLQQQQYTLDFFAAPECIQLINALFYYKLPGYALDSTSWVSYVYQSTCT